MWFEDGSEGFGGRAIGWLDSEHNFPTGQVEPKLFDRLKELALTAFQPFVAAGFHECEVCQFPEARGTGNLFIPADGFLFVCPELIVHYVGAHSYLPPENFSEAVMTCPDMGTNDYRRAFLSNGGREIMKAQRNTAYR